MKVHDVMTREPVCCGPSETLTRAARLMWDGDCGCLPVVDGDARLLGMVTDRDICMATLHAGRPLHELLVSQAMANEPVACRPEDDVAGAQALMCRARVRRLPVTDADGYLLGVLSLHDLARTARRERRWFSGVKMADIARTFAEVSRPRQRLPRAGFIPRTG